MNSLAIYATHQEVIGKIYLLPEIFLLPFAYNMKLLFPIFLVLAGSLFLPGFSQQSKIDSLHSRLAKEAIDTSVVDILLDISFEYRNSKPDSTISYAERALVRAEEIKYLDGEVLALRNIALGFQKKGDYETSISYLNRAVEKACDNEISSLGDVYNTLGTTYYFTGNYDSAIFYFNEGAEIFAGYQEWNDQAGNFANIGVIAETQGNELKALEYYQLALNIFEREGNESGMANIRSNMGSILEGQGKYDEALEMYESTLAYDVESNNVLGAAITTGSIAGIKDANGNHVAAMDDYRRSLSLFIDADALCRTVLPFNNIGRIHLEQKAYDSARIYFTHALAILDTCEVKVDEAAIRLNYGDYYLELNQKENAKEQYAAALSLATEIGLLPEISDASEKLYSIHKDFGQTDEALRHLEIYQETFEKLHDEENARQMERLQAEYEFGKEKEMMEYEQQISELSFENELSDERLKRNTILIILLVVILLVVMLAVLYRQRVRSSNKLNKINSAIRAQKHELNHVNKELLELNEEKNTLIGIVAHDLKRPVNQIRGLLEIIKLEGDTFSRNMQDYLKMMDESSQRSVEMIDRILDIKAIENRQLEVREEEVKLSQLLDTSLLGFENEVKEKNIDIVFSKNGSTPRIKTDPLLLREIVDNLISNAVKFSPFNTTVKVALAETERFHVVKVKDQGPGISERDQKRMFNKYQKVTSKPTANEKSTGLGLAIVKRYADELGYFIECECNGIGTEFRVLIPNS